MAESQREVDDEITPLWVQELEAKFQRKLTLGHEIGAGAKCLNCKDACPGLDLHFWRKKCQNCKCGKEAHDVPEDDEIRFHILFKDKPNSPKYMSAKAVLEVQIQGKMPRNTVVKMYGEREVFTKTLPFDWVPIEASPALAAAYMSELPNNKMPISGSIGAKNRKIQLQRQIPLHDLMNPDKENLPPSAKSKYEKYMKELREGVGIGKILRVKQVEYQESSKPCDVQEAQRSGSLKPCETDHDPTNGNQNININENVKTPTKRCPVGLVPPNEPTPRTAMRSLPRFIPGSILRLPSSFRTPITFTSSGICPPMNPLDESAISINNNKETAVGDSSFADDEDTDLFTLQGIEPLPDDTLSEAEVGNGNNVEESQPLNTPGTSIPMNISGAIVTPSKYAQRKTRNVEQIADSDVENANRAGETGMGNETEIHYINNNLKCGGCPNPIEVNSVAVFIEKNGSSLAWHPACFTCKNCQELLVDLMYFYHKGSIYCARHYAETLNIQRCAACDELIFVTEFTQAEGKYFHLEHFCCVECDLILADNEYVVNDEKDYLPTCLPCFDKLYAKICNTCGAAIGGGQKGVSCQHQGKQLHWHATPECFKCANKNCNRSLLEHKFKVVNKVPFCSNECHVSNLIN